MSKISSFLLHNRSTMSNVPCKLDCNGTLWSSLRYGRCKADIHRMSCTLVFALEPLKDIKFFFVNACTILNGTLAWDVTGTRDCSKCLDIDPEMLYELENVGEKIA